MEKVVPHGSHRMSSTTKCGGYNSECKVYTNQACLQQGLHTTSYQNHHRCRPLRGGSIFEWKCPVDASQATKWQGITHKPNHYRHIFHITLASYPITFKAKPCGVSICLSVLNLRRHNISQCFKDFVLNVLYIFYPSLYLPEINPWFNLMSLLNIKLIIRLVVFGLD